MGKQVLSSSPSRSTLRDCLVEHRARRVLAALLRIGWARKRQSGSHRTLSREGWADFVFAFHDNEEIGPRMLARIAKRTGLAPSDL
jgi:predicted RNA binding protein YcfA (HicA-like mRNA interferase family)